MDGYTALQFARGRYGLTDYDRMDRQRCTIKAIIDAADPVTLLKKYQQLAATTKDIVSTDIPRSVLDDFVDLGFLVKDAKVRSVVFDENLIKPAYPDYDKMRQIVQAALASPGAAATSSPASSSAPSSSAPTSSASASPSGAATPAPVSDVGDACRYDPVRAQQALAAGQPPTKKR
jgi:anionic cell wall polymer biosynthesis LytR-Cps2A-Psr (LCP) family protein